MNYLKIKRTKDLLLCVAVGYNEIIDQLSKANSVCWPGFVLNRGWSCPEKSLRSKVKSILVSMEFHGDHSTVTMSR